MPDPVASTADTELLARVEEVLAPTFELDKEIGRGGMGIVYLARDRRLKRAVAIKVLPPELSFRAEIKSRFLREAETAAQLSHPNIVPIFTVDERGGLVFFVMAYVAGETLGSRLQREGAIPSADAARLLTEVASALAYAHSRGVIHRDIKPDNILLASEGGRAVVTDFGIARAVSMSGGDSRLTATGMAIGTPAYMSPEQCAGDKEVDGRSDLYSLGVVAYQMVSGQLPFSGSGTGALLVKHLSEKPVPVDVRAPNVPPWLAALIMRLLEKQPGDRYADAGALVRALESSGADQPAPRPRQPQPSIDPPATFAPTPPIGAIVPPPAAPVYAAAGMIAGVDRTRWLAGPVVRFRKRNRRMAIISAGCTVLGIFTLSGFLLTIGLALGGILAVRYSRFTHDEGYDWRDLFKQPRDRLFFDVAADSIDNARALFDRDKRAAMRERLRRGGAAPLQLPPPGSVLPPPPYLSQPGGAPLPYAAPVVSGGGATVPPPQAVAPPPAPPRQPAVSPPPVRNEAEGLASTEVLNGVHGGVVRRAATDRAAVRQEVDRLGPADRALLPDVVPTVDALVVRIAALATALHRLDGDLAPDALPELDKRIAGAEGEPATKPDRERKLALLRRQRATLQDLADRRASLSAQLESAGLVLQNIRFDLLRLRSAGIQSAIDDVTTATQEARALSREIGHVLNAAEEIKSV
jgi:eukaryotic-like serine/threonine-protein kinase